MESRDAPNNSVDQPAGAGFGHAPPRGSVRRIILAAGGSLVLLGLVGLLGWLTGLRPLTSVLPQYAPIALYAAVFFVAAGCVFLWHANRARSSLSFSIAMAASALISLTGFLGVASYFTGVELTLESLIVPPGELVSGLPMGHISPVGGVLLAFFAPALWLGLHPGASARSRQFAAAAGLFIAFAGATMAIGYLLGTPLLYGGEIIPVAALAALGFVFLGSGLAAAVAQVSDPGNGSHRRDMPAEVLDPC